MRGYVYAIAVQSDGKVLIGGFFSGVNGAIRDGIARLNPNGTLDSSFNPGIPLVDSIAQQRRHKLVRQRRHHKPQPLLSTYKKAGGISFADGHSEIKRWLDVRTTRPIGQREVGFTVTPMPNNPDVFWLMDRCTRFVER